MVVLLASHKADFLSKIHGLKIIVGFASKNTRWGSGLLCLFAMFVLFAVVEGWRVEDLQRLD